MTATDDSPPHSGEVLPPIKSLTPIQRRLLSMPTPEEDEDISILYQHSVLCQTSMPYRNPGDDIRLWERMNGIVHLEIQAGRALNPETSKFVDVGLPFGPKPRLVLYHLNAEAIRTRSPVIELEDSLTAFVRRTLGLDAGGRNIRPSRSNSPGSPQPTSASAPSRRATPSPSRAPSSRGSNSGRRDTRQLVLWPTTIQFSDKYFQSLVNHAVPLNEMAVARLAHSAMALDIYAWLAQRLHRVKPRKPAIVPWVSLHAQFGQGYGRICDFKREFRDQLRAVKAVYPEARLSEDGKGLHLSNSRPPIAQRLLPLK